MSDETAVAGADGIDAAMPVDGATFRKVLGTYPTGVTLVAAADADGPAAMVIGSFGSVSLDPPLVQFMPAKTSGTWRRIEATGAYSVNVLGADQIMLCRSFFAKDRDPFDDIAWHPGPTGSPILDGALSWIDCRIDDVHDAGDHWIVIGRVVDLGAAADGSAGPLIFSRGAYGTFAPFDGA